MAGFDVACLPKPRTSLLRRSSGPGVLARYVPHVDAAAIADAWKDAVRAKLPSAPVVLLLFGRTLDAPGELARAVDLVRRRSPALAAVLFPVPVDVSDWSAYIPADAPKSARAIVDRLRAHG